MATAGLRQALGLEGAAGIAGDLAGTRGSVQAVPEASITDSTADSSTDREAGRVAKPLAGSLEAFCNDLNEESRSTSTHPFIGREREITAVLETLCRKLKNNPLLIGKPGVGKTALVSAVSRRLSEGNVPARLRERRILEVSRLRLLADAKFSGAIEERLKTLLEEVQREGDIILFFDEIHSLLGAGGAAGTGDVANLLKSSLSRGEITCIGATTLAEYYKHIARDEALARRFSTITIEEPSADETRRIVSLSRVAFENYHGVGIAEDVIDLIVDMADRYLYLRSFPDKAFDLLDKTAAKVALAGRDVMARADVTETVAEMTGLPLEMMDEDPADRLERLEDFLDAAVPGQSRAARDVARLVRIAKLRLELRPEQPDGIFLFVGPEGVGKHEMAMALAKFLYGSAQKMTELDLSQFGEPQSLSRLVGAEPGYVGYGDRGGLLSKAAQDSPHSVLYFRNIDLAHPVIQQFLGEAFEQGRFTDASGATISLSYTTVAMSLSRVSEGNRSAGIGFTPHVEEEDTRRASRGTGALARAWGLSESLVAAVDEIIEFQVLDRPAIEKIVADRIAALVARLEAAKPVAVRTDPDLPRFYAQQLAVERKSLAQLERILQETIVIPFTNLRIDRRTPSTRPEILVRVTGQQVVIEGPG
jgi:ATP-dependent Clp protease ATP-binding subunit ClpC